MNEPRHDDRRSNFITAIIDHDLETGKWGKRVATRFPPEPNGYLHIGHAKSICLNFGLAIDYQGTCNLRFDDTNPTKEEQEYVESIQEDIRWLGFTWSGETRFASDYFETMYEYAVHLIKEGKAYVCSLSKDEIREYRGSLTEPGKASPYRSRSVEENLDLFQRMRAGEFADGEHVLRAKIDMSSPNMLMRDPLLYRIVHAHHHRTGDDWCIYPMYDYAHCLEDAIEHITHSICTLEFENNRELYDWVLDNVPAPCHPQQIEFARLSLDYTIMSKRRLLRLVEEGHVSGWDDPRMPTIAGLRRRGVTPEAIRAFSALIGVAKTNSTVDYEKLEYCIRDDLNHRAPRVMCVLDPLKVVITNWPEGKVDELDAPLYPHDVPLEGSRKVPFSGELYIEREDFALEPPKGFYRLAPGREVRLRYGYFITCDEVVRDEAGEVVELRCSYDPDTRGGSSDTRKVKGTLHWVSASHSLPVEVRLYDRLFTSPNPVRDAEEDFTELLNPESLVTLTKSRIEPSVHNDPPGTRYQFERNGYFISDAKLSDSDHLVYNRIVTLRDTWAKLTKADDETDTAATEPAKDAGAKADRRPSKRSRAYERQKARENDPELLARYERFVAELGLSEKDADILTAGADIADFFEAALTAHDNATSVAKWTVNEVLRELDESSVDVLPFDGPAFGRLVALVDDNTLNKTTGQTVFAEMVKNGGDPAQIVEDKGLAQVDDRAALAKAVDKVIADNRETFDRLLAGEKKLMGVFIGHVMRATGGKADAGMVRQILADRTR